VQRHTGKSAGHALLLLACVLIASLQTLDRTLSGCAHLLGGAGTCEQPAPLLWPPSLCAQPGVCGGAQAAAAICSTSSAYAGSRTPPSKQHLQHAACISSKGLASTCKHACVCLCCSQSSYPHSVHRTSEYPPARKVNIKSTGSYFDGSMSHHSQQKSASLFHQHPCTSTGCVIHIVRRCSHQLSAGHSTVQRQHAINCATTAAA
jgi:hypothetical protein